MQMTKRHDRPKVATGAGKLPQVTIYFDNPELLKRFRAVARKDHRSLSAQALYYIERGMADGGTAT